VALHETRQIPKRLYLAVRKRDGVLIVREGRLVVESNKNDMKHGEPGARLISYVLEEPDDS
jgi:hypothetical protein